jgi:hypothetical protein
LVAARVLRPEASMAKFFLILGFMLALSALGFAAANAGDPPPAPERAATIDVN